MYCSVNTFFTVIINLKGYSVSLVTFVQYGYCFDKVREIVIEKSGNLTVEDL